MKSSFKNISLPFPITTMSNNKRCAIKDITNISLEREINIKKHCTNAVYDMLPVTFETKQDADCYSRTTIPMQNKHPLLAMYNPVLVTESMSFTVFEIFVTHQKSPNY